MTDKRLKEILSSITIIIDSRERENSHIKNYFDSIGIKHETRCLKYADYSFQIPIIPELGNSDIISFENSIVLEKKNSLEEISGNLCNAKNPDGTVEDSRDRFERELQKSVDAKTKFILMIEDSGGWQNIIDHKYDTEFNPAAFTATLFAFRERYNIHIDFIPKKLAGWHIMSCFKYHLRKYLKDLEVAS